MDHWTRFRRRIRLLAVIDWLLSTPYGGASHWPLARSDQDNWEALHQDAVDRSTDLPPSLLARLEEPMERRVRGRK